MISSVKTYFIILVLAISSFAQAQTKRALIVAIGDYPEETKWRPIHSLNDIPLMQMALEKQGFTDFIVITNEEADKKGIIAAIAKLESKAQKNDIIVLHFSSHGQRIADDNGDELDGYDEAIVAYGAHAFPIAGYNGQDHLRDDQIEDLVAGLRRKVGKDGDVLMIADACHSGTISRGEISRGGMPPFEDPNNPPMARGQEDVGLFQITKASQENTGDMAPFVLISASQASEVNYEFQGAGSLSTAFSRASAKIDQNMSYRNFFAQIMKEMSAIAPRQIPAIEGDIDRTIFAGKAVNQENYYTVRKIREADMNLNGGTLTGLYNKTEIAVYPAGTQTAIGATALATGKVINAEGTWSKVKLDKPLLGNPETFWVFVTKQTYGDLRVRLKLKTGDAQTNVQVKNVLADFPLALFVEDSFDFEVVQGSRGTVDLIQFSNSTVFAEDIAYDEDGAELKEKLKNYAKGKRMKEMEMTYPGMNVVFEFIPLRLDENFDIIDTLELKDITKNGVLTADATVGFHIRVTNNGTNPAYFAILDIQPDGQINGIIPDPNPASGHRPEQFQIAPGVSYVIPDHYVKIFPPYGLEVFKLFATKDVVDYQPIITQTRTRNEGGLNDFEMLISDAIETATRGGESGYVNSNMQGSTYSISFIIEEMP